MSVFELDTLERLPASKDYYAWADYVEILCFTHIDGAIPKSYIVDRINERNDVGESSPIEIEVDSDDYDYESLEETAAMPSARDARQERFIEDVFRHLEYRQGTFKEYYPFTFSEEGNTLELLPNLTSLQKLYLFLLIASNLKCIKPRNNVTMLFEIISCITLTRYLPPTAKVFIFGTNPYDRVKRYSGNLYKKITTLANDLRDLVICQERDFSPQNNGDGGLDLVAWVPFLDSNCGDLRVLGQCACTEEWVSKQHSSNVEAWSAKIHFHVNPINMIFVPYCYRSSDGEWYSKETIHMSVLIDRVRILNLMSNAHKQIPEELINLVNIAMQEKVSIY